ncbi:MAG: hypothetical protein C4523_15475 [Myxococcales bacterium]|nr:MAG: hypothetical protein C4523_15475 [Myxococcales bacterium]
MPFGPAAGFFSAEYLSAESALRRLAAHFPYLGPLDESDTALRRRLVVDGREVAVGFITPVSHPFCGRCDRLRLDSRGRLYPCLRQAVAADLGDPARAGQVEAVRNAVQNLLAAKCRPEAHWTERRMHAIGG